MNPQRIHIAASLTLHAAFISLIFILPETRHQSMPGMIHIHLIEASSSVGVRDTLPRPAKRAVPPPPMKQEAAAPSPLPEKDAAAPVTAEENATAGNAQSQLPTGNSMVVAAKHTVRGVREGSSPAARPAVMETSFGATGAPAFAHRETPTYPPAARRLGKEGRVILRLTIDSEGRLLAVEIVEDAGYGFSEAAVEAVRKSTFTPALRNGQRMTARAILPVRFRLQ